MNKNAVVKIVGLFLVFFVVVFLRVPIFAEMLDVNIEVLNTNPEVVSVFLSDDEFGMVDEYAGYLTSPMLGTGRKVYLNGYIIDNNGEEDLDKVRAVFYRSGVENGYGCEENSKSCYRVEDCLIEDFDAITKRYSCEIDIGCDVGITDEGMYEEQDWRAYVEVMDLVGGVGVDNSASIETVSFGDLCNGDDDDCDGEVDEGYYPSTCGVGVCELTVETCLDGVTQVCVPLLPTEVSEYDCKDGLDNDCNGFTDLDDPVCFDIDYDVIDNEIEEKLTGDLEALSVISIGISDDIVFAEDEDDNTIISGTTFFGSGQTLVILPSGASVPTEKIIIKSQRTRRGERQIVSLRGVELPEDQTKRIILKAMPEVCVIDKGGDVVIKEGVCKDMNYQRLVACDGEVHNYIDFPDGQERNFICQYFEDGFVEILGISNTTIIGFWDDDGDRIDNEWDQCPGTDDAKGCGIIFGSSLSMGGNQISNPRKIEI